MHRRTRAILIGLIFIVFLIIYYLASYGFSFPPCSSYEIPLTVSNVMQTSDIVFEKQMYYVVPPNKESRSFLETCAETIRQEADGYIEQDNAPYQTAGYEQIPIAKGARFTLVRAAKIEHRGVGDFEGGQSGEYYLLSDNRGKNWYIRPINFKNMHQWNEKGESKWVAGYYHTNQRVGDVVVE